jgi:leucyl/phenylalanyl-tRNA--protein transferase
MPRYWLDPHAGDADGLLGIGGDLTPATLIEAYCSGVFPWYSDPHPIMWWSPDPRAIFALRPDGLYRSRRLLRTLRSGKFTLTRNRAFRDVMAACGERRSGTWVTPAMLHAYERLHRLGLAHSIEAWYDGQLAGGVYGVALNGFFSAESMFYRVSDASKVALCGLFDHLLERQYQLLDVQIINAHTESLGAIEIPRGEYLLRLAEAVRATTVRFAAE